MKRLKLNQGLSYPTKGFSCIKGAPFDAEDDLAEKLLGTGRFEEISEPALDTDLEAKEISADDIGRMKKDELIALAEKYGINIEDCRNNDERAERIQGFLGLSSFAKMGLEN